MQIMLAAIAAFALVLSASAAVRPFPPGFRTQDIKTDGATIHVRVGGKGPAVVMLHGFGDTGDMWAPLAAALAKDHTIIVPDLRGMGLSSYPDTGYDKKTQAQDIARVNGQAQCAESRTLSRTTSATWSATRSPRNTPIALHAGSSSMRRYRALARGTRFSRVPCCGTSISAVRMSTGW
jgi:hypothetical protein